MRCLPLLCAGVLAASCTDLPTDPLPTSSARVHAVFAPNAADPCLSDLPFPIDLARDPASGKMKVPFCTTDDADTVAIKRAVRELDGYALNPTVVVRFSGPIEEQTLAGAVYLLEAATGERLEATTKYLPDRKFLLKITPAGSLKPGTRYLVAVTRAITEMSGLPVIQDQAFTLLSSRTPLVDAYGYSQTAALDDTSANGLEAVRLSYQEIFEKAEAATGLQRESLAVVFTFTTTTFTAAKLDPYMADAQIDAQYTFHAETAILAKDHLLLAATGLPIDRLCSVHTGRVDLRSYLDASGRMIADPAQRTKFVADYLFITPKVGTSCDTAIPDWDPNKLAVYVHGLGRCKNDALALANALAAAGWATLSIDGPRAGPRSPLPLGDSDMDGCPDQPATPSFIALGDASPNPFVIRDELWQWALELKQVVARARETPWELTGQAAVAGTPPKMALIGHSWGGIAAVVGAPHIENLDSLVVSAASGGLGGVFEPLIIASTAAGLPSEMPPGEVAAAAQQGIATFQWGLEPADPLAFAPAVRAKPLSSLVQVVNPGAVDVPLHALSGQQRLQGALASTGSKSFLLADNAGTSICDDVSLAVGTLLKPCIANKTATAYAQAAKATQGAQRQVVQFLQSHTVCDPNPEVSCP